MKNRIFIAILAFIIIGGVFSTFIEFQKKKETTNYLADRTKETKIKLKAVRGSYKIMIETFFNQIISTPNVLDLYSKAIDADEDTKNTIRDSLYNLLLPIYKHLKISNIRQFNFILPNSEVLLRFHRPKIFGDDLADFRYSIKMANKTKEKYSGFEEGKIYNGFRNVFPVSYNNKHIGLIDIGFSFAINLLFTNNDDVFNHMIKKEIVDLKLRSDERENYVQSLLSDNYLFEKDFLHYDNEQGNILKEIDRNIKSQIADRLANNENFSIHQQINKTDYFITFIAVRNVEGNPVAYIISYHKDKNVIADLNRRYFVIHIISLILLLMIILVTLLNSLKKMKLKKIDIQYKKIIDANTDVVVVLDQQGAQLFFNKQLEILLGYKQIDVIGKSFIDFLPKTEIEKSVEVLKESFLSDKSTVFESFALHKKGHFIPVEITAQTMIYNNTKAVVCTIRDITKRRKSAQKLIDNEIQQRKILETFKEGIYIVSPDYKISYMNSALQKKIGKNTIGEICHKALYNRDEKCSWCIYENLKVKKGISDYEFDTEDNRTLISNNILLDDNSKLTILTDITEKKKAEQEIRKLSTAIEQSANIIIITDVNGDIEYTNPKFTELTGYTAQEVLGENPRILSAGTKTKEYYKNMWDTLTSGKIWRGEFHNKKKNGEHFWEKVTITAIKNEQGEIINYLAIKEDFTATRKAEQELKESEEKYRSIIENMIDGFYKTDVNGIATLISPSVTKILGFSEDEIIGKEVATFYANPDERNLFLEKIKKTGKIENNPAEFRRKEGENIFIEGNAQVIYKNGKYDGVEGVIRDVTERKKAEKILRLSNRVLEASPDHIAVIRKDFIYEYVNNAYVNAHGIDANQIKGKHVAELLGKNIFENLVKPQLSKCLAGEEIQYESWFTFKNIGERFMSVNYLPLLSESKSIDSLVVLSHDITNRKKAEQDLLIERDNLKNIFEAMEDGIYIVNQEFDIEYVNPVLTKDFGDYQNRKCYEYFHNRNKVCEWCKNDEILEGKTVRWEWYSEKTNKTYDLIDTPLLNSDGSISKLEIFRDITDYKNAENKLKESEEALNQLIENTSDGISIMKEDQFVFLNTPFSKILNYSVKELQHLSLKDILSEESYISLKKEIAHFIDSDREFFKSEVVMVKKDKSFIDAKIMIKCIKYKDEFVHLFQISDISKQKEIMKLLQKGAEQTKGLNEFIPICAGCNLIRDDEKEGKPWVKPADYITERLPEIKFSHGMCPDCLRKWYPDIDMSDE